MPVIVVVPVIPPVTVMDDNSVFLRSSDSSLGLCDLLLGLNVA